MYNTEKAMLRKLVELIKQEVIEPSEKDKRFIYEMLAMLQDDSEISKAQCQNIASVFRRY